MGMELRIEPRRSHRNVGVTSCLPTAVLTPLAFSVINLSQLLLVKKDIASQPEVQGGSLIPEDETDYLGTVSGKHRPENFAL